MHDKEIETNEFSIAIIRNIYEELEFLICKLERILCCRLISIEIRFNEDIVYNAGPLW